MGIDLVTLAQYKAYAGISSTTQDAAISAVIPRVSALVKSICRRTFVDWVDDSKVENFKGGDQFVLQETPVLQVQSVEYSLDYGATYSEMTEFVDYALDLENDSIVPLQTWGYQPDYWDGVVKRVGTPTFPKRVNGYRVTYTAGYETLPEDLKLALLDLINYYMRNDSAVHSTRPVSPNTMQIEYVASTNLPAHIKRVLDLYTSSYN
jgi:hypothetical protein